MKLTQNVNITLKIGNNSNLKIKVKANKQNIITRKIRLHVKIMIKLKIFTTNVNSIK